MRRKIYPQRKQQQQQLNRLQLQRLTLDRIQFDPRRRAFVYRGRLVSGLLPSLQALLYPEYTWAQASRLSSMQNAGRPKQPQKTKQKDPKCHGPASGRQLDRQLSTAIQFARTHGLECSLFVNAEQRRQCRLTPPLARRLQQIAARLTTPARHFFRMCHVQQLTPVRSQSTVGCVRTPIATMVDVTCISKTDGAVVLIENKVGFSTYLHASTGRMHRPCDDRSNSPYNQHQMQLALTTHLHNMTHPHQPASRSFVWRYDETGVTQYPLEAWASEKAPLVLNLVHRSKIA